METLTLHEDARSGNCHKIRLTAALLGLPIERIGYDIMRGETRTPEFLAQVNANGEAALALMDEHLAGREWLVGENASLADVALFAYTHVSEAGGYRLHDFTNLCAWLERLAALPGYVPMD